jgi:hypothetical protein
MNRHRYIDFELFDLDEEGFSMLYIVLENFKRGLLSELTDKLYQEEEILTDNLYKDYKGLTRKLLTNIKK